MDRPLSISQHDDDDFTVEYFADGSFRLCLHTADPNKIPRFKQAVDCVEGILRLPLPGLNIEEIDNGSHH